MFIRYILIHNEIKKDGQNMTESLREFAAERYPTLPIGPLGIIPIKNIRTLMEMHMKILRISIIT